MLQSKDKNLAFLLRALLFQGLFSLFNLCLHGILLLDLQARLLLHSLAEEVAAPELLPISVSLLNLALLT